MSKISSVTLPRVAVGQAEAGLRLAADTESKFRVAPAEAWLTGLLPSVKR
jgi:hypothetical protein